MRHAESIRVWDPWVRVGHWLLAGAFFTAYATAEDETIGLHAWAGYIVAGYIVWRLLWGVLGSPHARFSDFVTSPRTVAGYLGGLLTGRARRYEGHNPAGGWMIVILLFMLAVTTATGLVVYAGEFDSGPLVAWLGGAGEMAEAVEDVHEGFANVTMALVIIHVAGVIVESLLHRENLIGAMIHGRKRHD